MQMQLDGVFDEQLSALDLDGNGFITRQEYESFLATLPAKKMNNISIWWLVWHEIDSHTCTFDRIDLLEEF